MNAIFECNIDEDIIDKFKLSLMLNNDEKEKVIEELMLQYISASFSKASQAYKPDAVSKNIGFNEVLNTDTGKANNRIPKWAIKSQQNNHKIVKAFFQVESELGHVPLQNLEERCSNNEKYHSTYVRDFRANFNQMKIDAPKSHGKVFEVVDGEVVIWDYVKETLMEYKRYFI
ncbi:TPA: hypothetical protein ACG3P3_001463 [Clostridioides difficile]